MNQSPIIQSVAVDNTQHHTLNIYTYIEDKLNNTCQWGRNIIYDILLVDKYTRTYILRKLIHVQCIYNM